MFFLYDRLAPFLCLSLQLATLDSLPLLLKDTRTVRNAGGDTGAGQGQKVTTVRISLLFNSKGKGEIWKDLKRITDKLKGGTPKNCALHRTSFIKEIKQSQPRDLSVRLCLTSFSLASQGLSYSPRCNAKSAFPSGTRLSRIHCVTGKSRKGSPIPQGEVQRDNLRNKMQRSG